MSLPMDLATLCDTNGCHLAVFSEDVGFAHHIVATHLPPPFHPVGVVMVLAMPVKTI